MRFSARLLQWYASHARPLPWRQTKDPYIVWITEIILQQTRVDQGMSYFYRFVEAFPDVQSLAAAPLEKVLRLWQGLGYYSRARNLHAAARQVVEDLDGSLPQSSQGWLKIKGVGPYTAAAIASIAFNEPVPAVDGNVYRVLARLFAIDQRTDTAKGKKVFEEVASELIDQQDPGGFIQAMMDFGATICKPAAPLCHECLFNRECIAFKRKAVENFPLKKPRKTIRTRYFNYFFFFYEQPEGHVHFFVHQRHSNDIWKNLFELPLIETSCEIGPDDFSGQARWQEWFPGNEGYVLARAPWAVRHQLTHQTIMANFFSVRIQPAKAAAFGSQYREVDLHAFENMPKSRLTLLFFQKMNLI